VRCGPEPPIQIGGYGFCRGFGSAIAEPKPFDHPHRFTEPAEPLTERWELPAELLELGLVPRGADPEVEPTPREVVDRRADLRVETGVPVEIARDHEPDAHALRRFGHRGEHRPALEHRLRRIRAQREQVIEAPEAVEAGIVGDLPDRAVRLDGVDLRRELEADAERMGHRARA